jgi:serine/threonine protein kinase
LPKEETVNILAEPVRQLVCPDCDHDIDVSGMDILSPLSCPNCGARLTVPARLGDFLLVDMLGAGGMATVYKAYDESLGRFVAVKIMHKHFGEDPKFVERFLKEARAAARLNHPNVVQIYSCAEKNGQPYIVMEFVDGGKLDALITDKSPLPERRVLEIALDVANGLSAAADIGLVHGDIKPANIIFDRSGMAKVADFGLAHFAQEQQDSVEIWGTPYYIAPERARKKSQDQRSDIYCLGATLFHAVAGEPPFDGETAVDVVMERLKHPAPDLRTVRPEVSEAGAKLIARMLEIEKIRRYPNYNSLISDLQKALDQLPSQLSIGKSSTIGRAHATAAVPARSAGRKFAIVFTILLLLSGLGGGAWWFLQSRKPAAPPAAPVDAPSERKPEFQPFDAERDARLSRILEALTPTSSDASGRDVAAFHQGMASDDPRRMWCVLLRGVTAMLQGHQDEALELYRDVAETSGDEAAAAPPRRLAAFMAGEADSPTAPAESDWPQWYSDLAVLFEGVKSLADQQLDPAVERLENFAGIQPADAAPAWPYSLRTFAADLVKRIEAWRGLLTEIDKLAEEQNFDQAIKILRARVRTGLFIPMRDARIGELEQARQALQQEQREQERLRQQELAAEQARAEDARRVEEWEGEGVQTLKENRYKEAKERLQTIIGQIKNAEDKARLQGQLPDIDYLMAMKDFLVAALNSAPYEGGASVIGGTAFGADDSEIKLRRADGAETGYSWESVTPRFLIPMARHYLSQARIDDQRRAKIFMGLAAYSRLHGLGIEDNFVRYAEQFQPGISSRP